MRLLTMIGMGFAILLPQAEDQSPNFLAQPDVLKAIDARNSGAEALNSLPVGDRHLALGMIGDEAACNLIRADFNTDKDLGFKSLVGLSYCRTEADAALIINAHTRLREAESLPKNPDYAPIGAIGGPEIRSFLAGLMAEETLPGVLLINGLMQSVAYTRVGVEDLGSLDLNGQIAAIDALGSYDQKYAIRYLMARLKPTSAQLPSVRKWQADSLQRDLSKLQPDEIDLLVLETRSYQPNDAVTKAVRDHILRTGPDRLRYSVLRYLNPLDSEEEDLLISFAEADDEPPMTRVAALQQLARGKTASPTLLESLKTLVAIDSPAVAAAALSTLYQFDPPAGRTVAANWVDSDDIFKLFKAVGVLASDENGTSFLRGVMASKPDSLAVDIITPILDTTAPAAEPARPTPEPGEALKALRARVRLKTTKGDVVIGFNPGTPYAALNFLTLVEKALMDDMVFHRVIPNFVAQWGQTAKREAQSWGRVRDDWLRGDHSYGTVGVATAGRDTGSAQFFINLMHLNHLTGRYTVVGRVLEGMGVAENLVEGDRIIAALIEQANGPDPQQQYLDEQLENQMKKQISGSLGPAF